MRATHLFVACVWDLCVIVSHLPDANSVFASVVIAEPTGRMATRQLHHVLLLHPDNHRGNSNTAIFRALSFATVSVYDGCFDYSWQTVKAVRSPEPHHAPSEILTTLPQMNGVCCNYRLSPGFDLLGRLQVISGFPRPWPAVVHEAVPLMGSTFRKCNVEINQTGEGAKRHF